jgi:hypothetical protein
LGTREHCKFYNGNTGTKENKIREQGNTKYIGEQGNKATFLEYIQVLQWPNRMKKKKGHNISVFYLPGKFLPVSDINDLPESQFVQPAGVLVVDCSTGCLRMISEVHSLVRLVFEQPS